MTLLDINSDRAIAIRKAIQAAHKQMIYSYRGASRRALYNEKRAEKGRSTYPEPGDMAHDIWLALADAYHKAAHTGEAIDEIEKGLLDLAEIHGDKWGSEVSLRDRRFTEWLERNPRMI